MKKKTSILSCSPTSCHDDLCCRLLISENAEWSRKEGLHGGVAVDILSSFACAREPSRAHFCRSIILLQLLSKKKRSQQTTVITVDTDSSMISPAWVKKGQPCSSQLISGLVLSQSGLPSHFDVRRMHFLMPYLHGTRYGSSVRNSM